MTQKIYGLIPKVMAEAGVIAKDQTGDGINYRFRGIEDFYARLQPLFVKYGIFCAPNVVESRSEMFVNKKGNNSVRVTMRVCHSFFADDGSFVNVTTEGEAIDTSDKASNKAMSAAMKYAFIELFSIPTKVDDADADSPEIGNRSPDPFQQKIQPKQNGFTARQSNPFGV